MLQSLVAAIFILLTARLLFKAIWNLFFHPLRHLPGPKSWIAFPFLRHLAAIRGLLDICMRDFHQKYGEIVRFCPHEVSFITAQAWKDIYGHGHRQLPKALHSASSKLDILTANDADHSRLRKSLSHAFSAKGLQAQEPILMAYVDKLIERLKGIAESNDPTANLARWYNLATFDLIGDLAFGEPFGGLESSAYHHWITAIFDFIRVIAFIRAKDHYPLLVSIFLASLPGSFMEAQKKQKEHARITVQKRLDNTALHGRGDFMDSMLRNRGKENGLSNDELVENANILIIAGSETTATLLSGATYWLLRSPDILDKVTREVRENMDSEADITLQSVSTKLPYMLACITEALRLYPPVPGGLQRITVPSAPTRISGYDIPPNTRVSVHQSSSYWSPQNFHNPKTFIPERWLPQTKDDPTSPFYNDNRDVLQPFSTGPRNCIGSNLAHSEIRLILARMLWNFDLGLCEESRDWDVQKSFTLWEKNPLLCELSLVRRS